jgi:catechol 2,3-dioxygenase-like lactoylglutathione lyase family enzyme/glycerol uptake facilitator-like aquaporin
MRLTLWQALGRHWPEYLMEAGGLGAFMLSACAFTVLLFHPESPLSQAAGPLGVRRILMGLAMGLTAVALVYSPWGRRSGAHLNPVVTFAFWRLGKIAGWDAALYAVAHFLGGMGGVVTAGALLRGRLADPAVRYAVTVPGPLGPLPAFGAEVAIAFLLMLAVLAVSNSRIQAWTGVCAGTLVAVYVTVEAPLSGMSMNPARTLASAVPAGTFTALWVYFTAPVIGMLLAADLHLALARGRSPICAKLYHSAGAPCIFRCGYAGRDGGGAPGPAAVRRPRTRSAVASLWVLTLIALAAPAVVAQVPTSPAERPMGRIAQVGPIGLTVSDMDRSVAFYGGVLGFERMSDVEVSGPAYEQLTGVSGLRARVVTMQVGRERLELTEYLAPRGRPAPADSRSNDAWFQHVAIITSDIEQAYLWLRRHKVEHVSPGPQRLPDWNPKAGGIVAFYFRDPDGHPLEILQFPPDKGAPRWHRAGDRIFLGIDHTAIVVADTERSLRFYRDRLGLAVAGESENWGLEQERLNGVVGARLRITTLRAPSGPGVELLEYLAPRTGRPAPVDAAANDLVHWHTAVVAPDPAATAARLRDGRAGGVSPGPVPLPDGALGIEAGFLVRDPDGHALRVTGPEASR